MHRDEERAIAGQQVLRDRLAQCGTPWSWRQGHHLIREGDRAGALVLVEHGTLKVSSHTAGGNETVHAVLGPGDLVGELAALDGRPHAATVIALTAGAGRRMSAAEFRAALADDADSTVALAQVLASRIRGADQVRNDLGAGDVETRVAQRLWHLAQASPPAAGDDVDIDITQDDLARWCGASRQAVNAALGRLRAAGVIRTGRGTVAVVDVDALVDRAGDRPSEPT